jgi:hypothetical protein
MEKDAALGRGRRLFPNHPNKRTPETLVSVVTLRAKKDIGG